MADNGNGIYTATLTSSATAGTATVTGTVNGAAITDNASVAFTAGAASASTSLIIAAPTSITADGTSTSTVAVQLKDANGNNLTSGGDTVTLSTSLGSLGAVTDYGNSSYSATLTSSATAGTATVTGMVNGAAITNNASVAFTAGTASSSTALIIAAPTSITADGTSSSTVAVQLKDANGNNLTSGGDTVTLSTSLGSLSAVTDYGNSSYSVTLTSSATAGTATVTGTVNGAAITNNASVAFTAGAASASTALITAAPTSITADGTSTSTVTLQFKDTYGNDLTTGGDVVTLSTDLGTLSIIIDNGDGTYTATLTSSATAGTATITGTVNGITITDNATVDFTVGPLLNLAITDSSDPVPAGDQITYTLTFSNSSSADETALVVTLTATLPTNTSYVSASDGGTESAGVVTWSLGDLPPGVSGTRTLQVQVDSPLPNGTLLTNTSNLDDAQGNSATTSQTTSVQSAPVLSVSVTDSPDPVEAGGQITYNLNYGNSSIANETAFEVTLTDTIPTNAAFVTASHGGTVDNTGTLVTWSLGDLAPGASGIRILVVQVDSPLPNGNLLTNSATLGDTQGDSATASQTTSVQSSLILSVSVTDSPDPVEAGGQITYSLSYSNSSSTNETALGAILTDTLPNNTNFVSASDGGTVNNTGTMVTWSLGDLAPGASGTRILVMQVDSPLPNGTLLTKSATLGDIQGDSATASQTTSVQSSSILSLSTSDTPDPAEAGGQITYSLSYGNSNTANETALDAILTDTLPTNTSFVSASDGGTMDISGTRVTWSLGDLPPGSSGSRTLVLEVNSSLSDGSLLTNDASLEDNQGHTATSSQSTTVQSTPALLLSHSQEPNPVFPGDNLTITLSFSNPSSVIADIGATLTYTLSTATTFVSASDGATLDSSGTLITWLLGDLPPGASGTRSLVFKLDSSLSDGTLFTVNATLQDSEGHSTTLSITTPIGSNNTVGGTAEVTSPSPTFGGSIIIVLTSSQTPNVTGQSQYPGVTQFANTRGPLVTDHQPQFVEEQSLPLVPVDITTETQPQSIDVVSNEAIESTIQECETFLSLYVSDSPDPAISGDLITYTLTFTNSSIRHTAADVMLENILPPGMTFVAANEGGAQAGGVVIWNLGDMPPGVVGSRSVVAEVDPFSSSGTVLTNNNALLESNGQKCARANEYTALETSSNESTGLKIASTGSIILEEVSDVDDDSDGFANHYEAECGSDPLNPSSVCFTLNLEETSTTVQRGYEVTITASVERNFNFTGPISFSMGDDISVELWILPDLSTVLSNSNESVSTSFTIKTTNETPLGLLEKTIVATSGGMISQKTLTLEVVE